MKNKIVCIRENNCSLVCIDDKCNNSAFLCTDLQCPCNQFHKKCRNSIRFNLIYNTLQSKREKSQIVCNYLGRVKQIYLNAIKSLQKAYQQLVQMQQYIGLNQIERKCLLKFNDNEYHSLNGSTMRQIEMQRHIKTTLEIKDLNNQQKIVNKHMDKLINSLSDLIQYKQSPWIQSKIIKDTHMIQNFFHPKIIQKFTLLYRASDQQFQVKSFWEKCNNQTNTFTILMTEFNKIIGGYTPIAWDLTLGGKYSADPTRQTFLFSISEGHKIPLLAGKQKEVIYHASNLSRYGPIFGKGQDLVISDKANESRESYSFIGVTFNNGKYTPSNQQSLKKFTGQPNKSQFKILEWEVYKVDFK